MDQNNQAATTYLDQVFNLFSTRFPDGSRYPASRNEIETAEGLLKKARAAEPDDSKVIFRLERSEEIVSAARQREWCGSYVIVFFATLLVLFAFFGDSRKNVMNAFNWPAEEVFAKHLAKKVKEQEAYLARLENLPDSNPDKSGRIESAKEDLAKLRKKDGAKLRNDFIYKRLWHGMTGLFYMIYAVSMLGLYIYTARMPRFLWKKRQREYALAKESGNVLMKVILAISGMLFGIAGALFSEPPTRWVYYYTDGSKEYRDEHNGAIAGLIVLAIAVSFVLWVLHTVAMVVLYSIWAIVLVQYMRNYDHERLDIWMQKVKEKYAEWKEKRAAREAEAIPALPEPPTDKK